MLQSDAQVGWQDYVAVVLRRRWFFLVPVVVIVSVSTVVGLFLPKVYRAETVILLEDPKITNPLMQGMAVSSPVENRMRIIREELLGWTSLSRLVHELGMDKGADAGSLELEMLIRGLQKDIAVTVRGGDLITLAYQSPNPTLAQKVLNTITGIYIQRSIESQTAEAQTAIKFIESEMEIYKKKLEDSERALREFQELYTMQMPVATQLNDQVVGLEVQLAHLLVDNTEAHPTVVLVKRQIAELKQKRNEEIKKVIATAITKGKNPEIYADLAKALDGQPGIQAGPLNPAAKAAQEAYRSWVERLDTPVRAAEGGKTSQAGTVPASGTAGQTLEGVDAADAMSITLGPRQQQELARLQRDSELHNNTYHAMTQRLEQARMTKRLGESDEATKFKVIEPARLPLRPASPNVLLIFLTSLAGGIFLGACAAFAAEYLDQSFQSSEDLQATLALPIIGTISTIVTTGDVEARRKRMKGWISVKTQLQRAKMHLIDPVWSRLDKALVRWGL